MNADTFHYVTTIMRHQKGHWAATEKYVVSPGFSPQEAAEAMAILRKVCEAYERSLSYSAAK